VIGGGFIGVEVAASLASLGALVTVLERSDALWAGAFGRAVSDWAVDRLRAAGVDVRLGVEASVEDRAAEIVVAGVGVAPRVELAVAAGLEVDDGVLVDARQGTSRPGIHAAGDVARPRGGQRVEHWHAARESGERAAQAILGAEVAPARAPWIFSEFAGATLDALGSPAPGDEELAIAPGLIGFARDGALAGAVILDAAVPVDAARSLLERGGTAAELADLRGTRR
jgi:3-phenylpropionate/trans-cinnamate dioxygenase ferredoxin reductase subunit